MLFEQIIERHLRGPGPTPNMYSYNKSLEGKSSSGLLFTAKMLRETMHLTSPFPDQNTIEI